MTPVDTTLEMAAPEKVKETFKIFALGGNENREHIWNSGKKTEFVLLNMHTNT